MVGPLWRGPYLAASSEFHANSLLVSGNKLTNFLLTCNSTFRMIGMTVLALLATCQVARVADCRLQLMSLVKIPTLGKDFEDQHLDPRSGTMSPTVEGFHDVTCHWQLFHDVIDTCSMMSLSLTFSVVRHFEDQNGHWHRKVHAPELPICDFISGIIEQRLSLTDSAFVLFRETCLVSLSCHFESSRKNRWLVWPLQPWQGLLSCDCNSDFTLLFWPSAGDN